MSYNRPTCLLLKWIQIELLYNKPKISFTLPNKMTKLKKIKWYVHCSPQFRI